MTSKVEKRTKFEGYCNVFCKMQQDMVAACVKVSVWKFLQETEENHEPGQDLNSARQECIVGYIDYTCWVTCFVFGRRQNSDVKQRSPLLQINFE